MSSPSETTLASAQVSRRGADRVKTGHPWIYRSDLTREPPLPQGGPVKVVDGRGHFVALAHYSGRSKIALRLLSRDDQPIGRAFYEERIARALALRAMILPAADAARLVHGEADLLPGLIVDRYRSVLSVQTLTPAMDGLRETIFDILQERLQPSAIVERNDVKSRDLEGLPQRKGVVRGSPPGIVEYREGNVTLLADPLEGQKTGAFLDQQENHLAAAAYAAGDCLDCFAYVGGFALQLAPKAARVLAVEMAPKAAGEARATVARNGAANVEVRESNVFDLLRDEIDRGARYDTVVLDPPAFAKTKDKLEPALRGYKEINLRALQLLRPGGHLITCSCSYHVGPELFEETVLSAANDARRPLQIVERRGAGRDHPTLLGAPETRYLKVLVARTPA
ncbi:MAG: class I SAM-dependent rRNA methyltransferase [Myxococcales bacterium]